MASYPTAAPATPVHYTYSTPAYNGLYTSGHTTAFCGATDQFTNRFETTEARSYVTCTKCRAEVGITD